MLPSDLWEIIFLYLNDPTSCIELYNALPIDIQKRIKPMMDKHMNALSITMAYEVYHPEIRKSEIVVYQYGKLRTFTFLYDRVKTIEFTKDKHICIITKNGIFHRYDAELGKIGISGPLLPHFIDHAVFHPDGSKLVLISGSTIQLWMIGGHMINFTTLIYPIREVSFHPSKPLLFFSRVHQQKLIEVYQWNYYKNLVSQLPLQPQDEYILAEHLLDDISIEPLREPIRFSPDGEWIQGICGMYLKKISLTNAFQRPSVYQINRAGVHDYLWNRDETLLYYAYDDPVKNHRVISRFRKMDPTDNSIIYSTPCTINRLVGLVCGESKLIFLEDRNVYTLDLDTRKLDFLFECRSDTLVLA